MDITRRCDYACRILRSAYECGDSYISIADVAEKEDVPYSFARSIQHDLVKAGFLKTIRGVRGGLTLDCDPHEVTLQEVIEALRSACRLVRSIVITAIVHQDANSMRFGVLPMCSWRNSSLRSRLPISSRRAQAILR